MRQAKPARRKTRAFLRQGENPPILERLGVFNRIAQNGANGLTLEWMGRNTAPQYLEALADVLDWLLDHRMVVIRNDTHLVAVAQIPEPKRGKMLAVLDAEKGVFVRIKRG